LNGIFNPSDFLKNPFHQLEKSGAFPNKSHSDILSFKKKSNWRQKWNFPVKTAFTDSE